MNRYTRGVLIGMILGDGCLKLKYHIKKNGEKSTYTEFVIAHSPKQIEYLNFKANKIHSIVGGKPLKIIYGNHTLSNGITYDSYRIGRCHKYFRFLHRLIYSNNEKKYITRRVLDMLNPEGLAYWYMDDGGLAKSYNKKGGISSLEARIYTYCSEEEVEIIIEYFKYKWNIQFKKSLHKKTMRYSVRASTKEALKFISIVKPYIIENMSYKISVSEHSNKQERPTPLEKGDDIV